MKPKIYNISSSVETIPIAHFLKQINPNSSILEFGPGAGYMTKFIKEVLKCNVTCVELIPEMAEMAAPYAEKMIVANIETDSWEEQLDKTYDYIIFADVLEHLRQPDIAIQRVMPFLAPKGTIITSIPNIGHNAIIMNLRHGIFDYTEFGLLDNTHIHFFTRSEMNRIFSQNGLVCLEERSVLKRPSSIEIKAYYLKNLSLIFPLIRKKDGHVYQFICKWGRKECYSEQEKKQGGIRLNLKDALWCLMLDANDFIFDKWHLKLKLPTYLKPKNRKAY